MNKLLFSSILLLSNAFALTCCAQLDVRIKMKDIHCDSVRLQSFNWQKKTGTNLTVPYSEDILFKDKKTSLKPGMYWITADTTHISSILISAEKKQKFTLSIDHDVTTFEDSPENTDYIQYIAAIQQFNTEIHNLEKEFESSRNLPQYMLKTLADSLSTKAHRIQKDRQQYEQKTIQEHPGSLLSAIVSANMPMSEVPPTFYGKPKRIQEFIIDHYLDHFPWNDPRIFNTPIGEDILKEYINLVYQWDRPDLDTFVVRDLKKAASINKASYLNFYDRLEQDLGFYMSNYKVEHTYIKMLQEILTHSDIENARRIFYEYELATINKNLDGDFAPDFAFINEHGDTTTLYDFPSEYTLLLLHNPSCSTCREVRHRIAQYQALNDAIASGRFNVLTIYMENDNKLWDHYLNTEAADNYHHGWNFDQSIEEKSLYETRTIPYMFLLDKDKKIIRKNIPYYEIENTIKALKITIGPQQ